MPGMNGRQLYETIRQNRPEIRVLYMSGYPENVLDGSDVGTTGAFIGKPFSSADLAAKVRTVLDSARPPSERA
jgi:DNA-binding response OmpR family regulator